MPYVFEMSKRAASEVTKLFKPPMALLFEKTMYPLLLITPKKYVGMKYLSLTKPPALLISGFEPIRRDNCSFLRDNVKGTLQILMDTMDAGKALRFARKAFEKLAKQEVTIEELTISKLLAESYKNDSHIHLQVARYLSDKYPLLAPSPGERVPYVVVKLPGESRTTKNCNKGRHPDVARKERLEVDYSYYCYKQLKTPMDKIFCLVHGYTFIKKAGDRVKQPTDYLWQPYLDQICTNNEQQKGRVNGNSNLITYFSKRPRIDVDALPEKAKEEEELPAIQEVKLPRAAAASKDIRSLFTAAKK